MVELSFVLIIVIIQGYFNTPSYYIFTLLASLLYSNYKRNSRTLVLTVMLLILKVGIINTELNTLLENIHGHFYRSFQSFIVNYWPSDLTTFLISITVGTADTKLSKEIYYSFKRFNMLHVVSISGANFALIKNIFERLNKYFNKRKVYILVLIVQSYYIFLIGFDNLPALRAYLFTSITLYSSLTGRPINFANKLLLTVVFIVNINYESLNSMGFFLSIGFSIVYKCLELRPFNRIFTNEFKKMSLVFIISVIIFNSENPDFFANFVFSIIYPLLFVLTFIGYALDLIALKITIIVNLVLILINLILSSLNHLTSNTNTFLQSAIFIAMLSSILKSVFKKNKNEYSKFAQ